MNNSTRYQEGDVVRFSGPTEQQEGLGRVRRVYDDGDLELVSQEHGYQLVSADLVIGKIGSTIPRSYPGGQPW